MTMTAVESALSTSALPDGLWRVLVEASPEVTVIADVELVCRFASDSVLEMSGFPADQLRGVQLARIIHRDDWDRIVRAMVALEQGDRLVELDARVRFSDGAWHDVNVRARRLERAEEVWIILTARDVSADRQNEAALLRKIELEGMLELVQRRFIHIVPSEIDEALEWAIREIAVFLRADSAYLLSYDLAARTESMTHEWTAPDREPSIDHYQSVSFDLVPIGADRSLAGEIVAIGDVAALEGTWSADREFLLSEGLVSMLELPIIIGGRTVASLGFDWSRHHATWTSDDLVGLSMFAASFAQVLARRDAELELARTVDQLRMGFEGSPVPLALIDREGTLLRVNDELCRLLAHDAGELVGRSAASLFRTGVLDPTFEWGPEHRAGTDVASSRLEAELETGDGGSFWADITIRPVTDRDGQLVNLVARFDDITSVKQARAALDESEARFATLVDNLPDPVMRVGPDGEALFSNQAANQTLFRRHDGHYTVDPTVASLLSEKRVAAFETGETQTAEYEVATTRGRRYLETRFVPEPSPDGQPRSLLLVSADLTERRRGEAELAYRATHDALTDLANRASFLASLDAALGRMTALGGLLVGVLFFDLDRFKVVNDSLGHTIGDQLLVAVARRLRAALRPDDVVARLGGDEFTVLIDDAIDVDQVLRTAERLAAALADPIDVGGRPIVVSCSIGVAMAVSGNETSADLVQWADAAMYRAKDSGRSRISLFDDTLAAEVSNRLELDQRLRHAIELEEFEVHYQPEVDLVSGRILGCEALLRWRTDTGLVSAAEFIDLAEETGLILPIGAWVLEEACHQGAKWAAEWPARHLVTRVNLSARQLDDDGLVEMVRDVLARSGLAPENLCLEITETALMADAEASRKLLQALYDLGVSLAVDDFGTGYSSLSYLKQFPVDVLKIDRSFVAGLTDDTEDVAIVTTIIRLAETLGMHVTAEGIETRGQADVLTGLGCSRGQGFYFARPMPVGDFSRLLEDPG